MLNKDQQLTFRRDELLGELGCVMDRVVLVKGEVEMRGDDSVHYVQASVWHEG